MPAIDRARDKTLHEVIAVNNLSLDGSAEAIACEIPEVTLLTEREPTASRANKLAVTRSPGECLLLLNLHTMIIDRVVNWPVDFARETPRVRIWVGRTVFVDRRLDPTSCWRRVSL